MSFTAFVPARSGSKRLPNKNIRMLGGKPLVVWTIEACLQSQLIRDVMFSTDSTEYWDLIRKHIVSDRLILDFRKPEESGDTIKIFDYLKNNREKIFGKRVGAFVLALPTTPLRGVSHINEAINLFNQSGSPVFSATNYGFPVSFAFRVGEGHEWTALFKDSPMVTGNTRSQLQVEAYHPNGAIYVRALEDLHDPEVNTLYDSAIPYLMSRDVSIDIDTDLDLKIANALL